MKTRTPFVNGARLPLVAMLLLALFGGGLWWLSRPVPAAAPPPEAAVAIPAPGSDDDDPAVPLPVPPVPPRIADGASYEACLQMLNNDPAGANTTAQSWMQNGGGDGATHCEALAQVALGNPERGAAMLDALAATSKAPGPTLAIVLGQAVQAWMMAGRPALAQASATRALALTPDDPDLLIDRAVALVSLQEYMEAIDDLTRALDLDHYRTDALVFRGAAWRRLGQLDLAQDDIDRALIAYPDMPEALLERGILRQRRGDSAGARADWQRASDLAPDTATGDLAEQNMQLLAAGPERR